MTIRRWLRKLRLRRGDILLIKRDWWRFDHIVNLGQQAGINFDVPIICISNKNELMRLPFEEIQKIYEQALKAKNGE